MNLLCWNALVVELDASDLSIRKVNNTVGHGSCRCRVGDDEYGGAQLFVNVLKNPKDRSPCLAIKRASRLIAE